MDYSKRYMSYHEDQNIRFKAYEIDSNSIFELIPVSESQFAILAPNERYVCSENGFNDIIANRTKIDKWETFTISKLLPPQ